MDNKNQFFPGKPINHRYQPAEDTRTILQKDPTHLNLASEVGFNPIATMLYGQDQAYVRPLSNTNARSLKPVATAGKVTLPVRGERTFDLSPSFKTEFEGRLQTLSDKLKEPKPALIGVNAPGFKQTITPNQARKLLPELTIANHKAKAVINQKLQPPEAPKPAPAAPVATQPANLLPPKPAAPKIAPLSKAPNLTQSARIIVGIRSRLAELIIELNVGRYRQSLLLAQMVETLEERAITAYKSESEPLKKGFPHVADRLKSLELILPTSALVVFGDKEVSARDVANHLITWLAAFNEVLVGYNAVLQDLKTSSAQPVAQIEKPQPVRTSSTSYQNIPTNLVELTALASKLVGAPHAATAKPAYQPINLPTPSASVEADQLATTKLASSSAEAIKPAKEAQEPNKDLIAQEVAAQLQKERSKIEEEVKEQLQGQLEAKVNPVVIQVKEGASPSSDLKPTHTVILPPGEEAKPAASEPIEIAASTETEAAAGPEKPAETTVAEPAPAQPIKVVLQVSEKRAGEDAQLKQDFTKTEGVINNLALEQLSPGERENLLSRLQSLSNQAEVMRQYDDLRYQKEKNRLSSELKILVEEASQKAQKAQEAATAASAAKAKETADQARKAKVAEEVKALVEREKARKARSTSVVSASPAYGKMVPPKVSFPNVINGIVRDKQGLLLSGVVMIIKDSLGEPVRALRSNKIGQFVISTPLPNGTYTIELEKEGQEFNIVQIEVKGEIMNPIEIRAL